MKARSLITTLLFTGLSYGFLFLLDSLVLKVNPDAILKGDGKIYYPLFFGAMVFAALILNRDIEWKGILFLLFYVVAGFLIHGIMIQYLLDHPFTLPGVKIKEAFTLDFRALFYLPAFPFILLIIIGILKLLQVKRFIYRLPGFRTNFNVNIDRFLAYLIDGCIVVILYIVFLKLRLITPDIFEEYFIIFGYKVVLEATTSMAIGKRILSLKVIKSNDGQLTTINVFLRNTARLTLIYWAPMLFGWRGLHDRLTGTDVIKMPLLFAEASENRGINE